MSADERPPGACLLCPPPSEGRPWRRAHERYLTCDDCLIRLREALVEIVDRYLRLDPRPGSSGGSRGGPGFESRSPASDHIIAMRDSRSSSTAKAWPGDDGRTYTEPQHPPLSIWSEFDTIVFAIHEQHHVDLPQGRGEADLARWINSHLTWASSQPLIEEIDERLRNLLTQLRNVTDRRATLAKCPNVLDDGSTCGRPLKAPLGTGTTIYCGCGRAWPRSQWEELGDLIRRA